MNGAMSKLVCRQNIERYERLLRTQLTDIEREFIEKRIAEESEALELSEQKMPSRNLSIWN